MTKTKKIISIICVVALLVGMLSTGVFAAGVERDYTITNPYADVDWSWDQYKADLHSHTNASDGDNTLKEMLETNYAYDFDIYAVSDHGLTSYSWTKQQVIPAIKIFVSFRKDNEKPLEALDPNGGLTFEGDRYDVVEENGSEYYYQTSAETGEVGHKMMRVPFANEQNPSSLNNAHVNTWFVDYGNGLAGGTSEYETPIKAVDELGGLSVINHPGEYTDARHEDCTADAYDYSDTMYKYYIDKFTSILAKYPSCMGIDINSKGDARTRYDRKLWDILLMNLAPTGRNVLGIATSDAHRITAAYTGYTLMLMPENTVDNLKNCMSKGEFFAASRFLGNPDELTLYANYLVKSSDPDAVAFGEEILAMQEENPTVKYEAAIGTAAPKITEVAVDDDADTITLSTENDMCVRWIADGRTIAYGNSIDLDTYSGLIGSYVRAEVFGRGGILYTQAFLLDYSEAPSGNVDAEFKDFWQLIAFVPDTLVRFLCSLDAFQIIYDAIYK